MASKSTKISTLRQWAGEKDLYATPKGLKIGSRGKVQEPGAVYAGLPKGMRRALRKELRRVGYPRHAAAPATE